MTQQGRGRISFLFLIVEIGVEARGSESPCVLIEASHQVSPHRSAVHQVSRLGDQSGTSYGEGLFSRVGRGMGLMVDWRRNMDWIMFVVVNRRRVRRGRRRMMLMIYRSVVVWLVVLLFV